MGKSGRYFLIYNSSDSSFKVLGSFEASTVFTIFSIWTNTLETPVLHRYYNFKNFQL
jgi:hypothetical protein